MVLEDFYRRPATLARLRLPPLGPLLDGFCEWLGRQGFSRSVLHRRLWQVSHFNEYLRRRGIKEARDVETIHGERFIHNHLPHSRCPGRRGPRHDYAPSSVRSIIEYLSEQGLLACPSLPSRPYQELLQEFLEYLKCERSLEVRTLKVYRECVTALLEALGAPVAERVLKLSPEQVLSFFKNYTQGKGPDPRRRLRGILRLFFRFCLQKGYMERDLTEALPPMRTYKLSGVPRGISEEDASKTLSSIERTTPGALRDFAILQLLHTYGVRGIQIRVLRLDDIRWSENQIRFSACKRGKEVLEPLTDEVGESLLEYLQNGRPKKAPYAEVFLTDRTPVRPLSSAAVSALVARRILQAGVSKPTGCSHAFRHGFATRMLQHGQPLKTIADFLGHRDINTTFIYTKVDLPTLRQLPLDWPEVHP